MFAEVRSHLLLVGLSLFLCCGVYPAALLLFGRVVAPAAAAGSLTAGPGGEPVGSRLLAQEFKSPKYIQPRPSAAGYNAAGSGGSNLAASNPKLRERVAEQLKDTAGPVPADAVTASGSGLDPHLSLAAARQQAGRVAAARGTDPGQVTAVLDGLAFTPVAGLAGEPLVNVLEANLELDAKLPAGSLSQPALGRRGGGGPG